MDKVELIARAICKASGGNPDGLTRIGFMGLFGPVKVNWTGHIHEAKAAIEAIENK